MDKREAGSEHLHHQNPVEITGTKNPALGDVLGVAGKISHRPAEIMMDFFPGGPNLRCLPDYGHKPRKRKEKRRKEKKGPRVKNGRPKRYTR